MSGTTGITKQHSAKSRDHNNCEQCGRGLPNEMLYHEVRATWKRGMDGAERDHDDFYRCRDKSDCDLAAMDRYGLDFDETVSDHHTYALGGW